MGLDPMAAPNDNDASWGRLAGVGLEVAIGVGLGYLGGHWLGNRYHWGPWGDFAGVMVGFAGGLYLLVKTSLAMNKK